MLIYVCVLGEVLVTLLEIVPKGLNKVGGKTFFEAVLIAVCLLLFCYFWFSQLLWSNFIQMLNVSAHLEHVRDNKIRKDFSSCFQLNYFKV